MRKTVTLIVAAILVAWSGYGMGQAATLDAEHEEPVAQIIQRIDDLEKMSTAFTQHNHIAALQAPLVSAGEVFVDSELGIAWYVREPLASKLIITDHGIDTGTGLLSASRSVAQLLRAVITGDFEGLSNLFSIAAKNDADLWRLDLHPKDAVLESRIESMQLQGSSWIQQLQVIQPGGNRIVITFSEPQPLTTLPARVYEDLAPNDL